MKNNIADKHNELNDIDLEIIDSEQDIKYDVMQDEVQIKNPRSAPKSNIYTAPALKNQIKIAPQNTIKQDQSKNNNQIYLKKGNNPEREVDKTEAISKQKNIQSSVKIKQKNSTEQLLEQKKKANYEQFEQFASQIKQNVAKKSNQPINRVPLDPAVSKDYIGSGEDLPAPPPPLKQNKKLSSTQQQQCQRVKAHTFIQTKAHIKNAPEVCYHCKCPFIITIKKDGCALWGWCMALCLLTCICCCVPCFIGPCYDYEYVCANCMTHLGVHKSPFGCR